jgi:hypothetical protein
VMGMDLTPVKPSADAPINERGKRVEPHYNWSTWWDLVERLEQWGIDTFEFRGSNDGDVISEATCKTVADAIEQHLLDMPLVDHDWWKLQVQAWRTCGGYYRD